MTITKFRTFTDRREAEEHLATLPKGAIYLERTEGVNPNPGRAAERLRARGVLTEKPVEVIELKDRTFAVPVPIEIEVREEIAADGTRYTREVKREGRDAIAVEKDQRVEAAEETKP